MELCPVCTESLVKECRLVWLSALKYSSQFFVVCDVLFRTGLAEQVGRDRITALLNSLIVSVGTEMPLSLAV
jgi:hypothetical protein